MPPVEHVAANIHHYNHGNGPSGTKTWHLSTLKGPRRFIGHRTFGTKLNSKLPIGIVLCENIIHYSQRWSRNSVIPWKHVTLIWTAVIELNPCRDECTLGNIRYMIFTISHISQHLKIVEIFPCRHEYVYYGYSILWPLVAWQRKGQGIISNRPIP